MSNLTNEQLQRVTNNPDADVPVPKGNGWELIQMAAESPGENTSGGVWLLWRSKYNVRPEERGDG